MQKFPDMLSEGFITTLVAKMQVPRPTKFSHIFHCSITKSTSYMAAELKARFFHVDDFIKTELKDITMVYLSFTV